MFKKKILTRWSLILMTLIGVSCQQETLHPAIDTPAAGTDHLVHAQLAGVLSLQTLRFLADRYGYEALKADIKYEVQVYQVTYLTTYQGREITASGLLAIPISAPGPLPLLSGHHGTTFEQQDAPTNFPGTFTGFELFAAAGCRGQRPVFYCHPGRHAQLQFRADDAGGDFLV